MVNFFRALGFLFSIPSVRLNPGIGFGDPGRFTSITPLLGRYIPAWFGHRSDATRTPFRPRSDIIPKPLGHHSDGALNPSVFDRNTVRHQSERCPAWIGTLSDMNRNQCPISVGIRTSSW